MQEFAEQLFTILTSLEAECFAINKAHTLNKATDDELDLSSILLEVVQVSQCSARQGWRTVNGGGAERQAAQPVWPDLLILTGKRKGSPVK